VRNKTFNGLEVYITHFLHYFLVDPNARTPYVGRYANGTIPLYAFLGVSSLFCDKGAIELLSHSSMIKVVHL